MLSKFVQTRPDDWDEFLPACLYAYNTSRHESSTFTPFQLMFARSPILPIDISMDKFSVEEVVDKWQDAGEMSPSKAQERIIQHHKLVEVANTKISEAKEKQKFYYDSKHSSPTAYDIGTKVLLKDFMRRKRKGGKLDPKWVGPFRISRNLGKGLYNITPILIGDRKSVPKRVHGVHLKVYHTPPSSPNQSLVPLLHEQTENFPPSPLPALEMSSRSDTMALHDHSALASLYLSKEANAEQLQNSFLQSPLLSIDMASGSIHTQTPLPTPHRSTQHAEPPSSITPGEMNNPIVLSDSPVRPTHYWVESLSLDNTDKGELVNGDWLTDKHMRAVGTLLIKQFPQQNGFQDPLILANLLHYESGLDNFIQIVNVKDLHWVCVSNIFSPPGTVDVFDSMPSFSINSSGLLDQVASILKSTDSFFQLRHIDIQRQTGSSDCGLFAIANSIALCTGEDPQAMNFEQLVMRKHLAQCFEQGHLMPFPKASKPRRTGSNRRIVHTQTVDVYCLCRLPWNKHDKIRSCMVQCNQCNDWFHAACVKLSKGQISTLKFIFRCVNCV